MTRKVVNQMYVSIMHRVRLLSSQFNASFVWSTGTPNCTYAFQNHNCTREKCMACQWV